MYLIELVQQTRKNGLEAVKECLKNGADVNAKDDDGWTALIYAVRWSNVSSTKATVKMLIDAGADVNAISNDGWTALMLAAIRSNNISTESTVKLLLDAGADLAGTLKIAHSDKYRVLYDSIVLRKMAFGLGRRDPNSVVSMLPREIVRLVLRIAFYEKRY